VTHVRHTHLIYTLHFPKEPGEVQTAFNINREASYIVAIKDLETPWWWEQVRFIPLKHPRELSEGTELVVISASADISREFASDFDTSEDSFDTVAIFEDLRIHEANHPTDPLIYGRWA
jgi:hypothetical protein